MWDIFSKNRGQCRRFRDSLESNTDALRFGLGSAASSSAIAANTVAQQPDLRAHLETCADCRIAAEEFRMSQDLLRQLPSRTAEPAPWFAARVMNAIAVREAELRRSLDTWSVVPKLAARLSWVSALALLLTGTWLYERPKTTTRSSSDSSVESLIDSAPSTTASDDVLASHLESE